MTGLEIIKQCESLRLEAYLCPAGIPTIGYGHTKGVRLGQKITVEQANQLLADDYLEAEDGVTHAVHVPLTQNQLEALTSFVFNLGIGNLKSSTLLKKINASDFSGAANEFDKWVFSKGVKLNGLVKRRALEKQLFKGE